ncbi:hypothetical protein GQ53DRAFT_860750 [Thozetella sp. PMI_491]|nr:hypothetical protein GQ53DRAFT_860750 [Thozetella sp. PMI_491]
MSSSATALLNDALNALGGEVAINNLAGVTYHVPNTYRSRSLMQSYELTRADTAVAIAGHQNISFRFSSAIVANTLLDYWIWDSPKLDPIDFSLVVRGGDDGFACYVRGNNQIWLPTDLASGYTDVHAPALDVSVVLDRETYFPRIIRTLEDHPVYGMSTNDLYLSDYHAVDGIMFPHHVQTIYNSSSQKLDATIEDYIVEEIIVNPDFSSDFFDGLPANESMFPKSAPKRVQGISHARITEFSSNMLWGGITQSSVDDLRAEQPVPGLPTVHWLILDNDTLGVKQLVLEFQNQVIVGDAPPQWTSNVIQWVSENLKKPITHLWPSHHHRDHSGGAQEYVAAGAKLIVPDMAVKYWSSIPNATFETFNDTHPFVYADDDIQAWFMWQPEATHAADWSYAVIASKCPHPNSSIAVFEADAWQAGMPAEQSDQAIMRQWLDQLVQDGLTEDAIILPAHGQVSQLSALVNITGYIYPRLTLEDWRAGALVC